jgi:DNA helicase IV
MSTSEIEREQEYVSMLYAQVETLRSRAATRLAGVLTGTGGTPQARVERDAAVAALSERVGRLEAAEQGLCFGRLDLRNGVRYYIGRIGVMDEADDGDPLLLDWRAPVARPFYVATPAAPEGVHRRRHIETRDRRVIGLDDEVLDQGDTREDALVGEGALMAALSAGRTGRMRDIVATLQAEQDEIIRSDHRGPLVVQGGPGTGKTAVALHRAAYLLYTHQQLARQGVLVVGPNATFLKYIGQVLPGLGETSVLLSTVGELFPGVVADRDEPEATAEVKGRAVLAEVLATAVTDRQGVIDEPVRIDFGAEPLTLSPELCAKAARNATATPLPHNLARPLFVAEILSDLAEQVAGGARRLADQMEEELAKVLSPAELAGLRANPDDLKLPAVLEGEEDAEKLVDARDVEAARKDLSQDPAVRAALEQVWPTLTPERLLTELFADPSRLDSAAPSLSDSERDLLRRPSEGGGWSVADVPLLDEAAELLGIDDRAERALAARERAERVAYAQGVLDMTAAASGNDPEDGSGEELGAADLLDAESLADRHEEIDHRTVAERAAADRTWVFGHVIVDEAQELSRMAWRLLLRRCPSRSMTIVGDVAQTGSAAGTSSWSDLMADHVGDRWRLCDLTVNYRTPAEIMAATADVLTALDPDLEPPRSVRSTGERPWQRSTGPGDLAAALVDQVGREIAALRRDDDDGGGGRLAVIVPDRRLAELGPPIADAVPGAVFGADADLESPVVVLGVRQVKGLEFDSVLIADPAAMLAASPRGLNDLYVALTRATRRLGVLHPGPPPAVLATAIPSNVRPQR